MRNFIRQFLLYSRSERRAVVALVILITVMLFIPQAYRFYVVTPVITVHKNNLYKSFAVDSFNTNADSSIIVFKPDSAHQLFYFDPNTATKAEWQKLGLTNAQAEGIERYKEKGGMFYKPEDLRKLYSLTEEDKARLIPLVRIQNSRNVIREAPMKIIEINTADSAAFEALYGVGPVLAARIVRYRNVLGGFYNIEQIAETYGITDNTFKQIRTCLTVNPALISKININDADYEILRKHPYIHAKIAHAIIGYRNTHGRFESMDELKIIKAIDVQAYEKIKHYLTIIK